MPSIDEESSSCDRRSRRWGGRSDCPFIEIGSEGRLWDLAELETDPLQVLDLAQDFDGCRSGVFEPVPAGNYRVSIIGNHVVTPVEDAVAVADAEAKEGAEDV